MSVLKIKTKKEKETFPMKKFVFNEETFNKYGDAETAAMEYCNVRFIKLLFF